MRFELPPQAGETVEGFVQRFVLFGEMQPDEMMDRLAEKARAGHGANADVPRQRLAESEVGVIPEFGDVQQDVVRALRGCVRETQVVEPLQKQRALMRIGVEKLPVIFVAEAQCRDRRLLQGGRRADGQKIVNLFGRVRDRRYSPAASP